MVAIKKFKDSEGTLITCREYITCLDGISNTMPCRIYNVIVSQL